jgi:hypothetical protein
VCLAQLAQILAQNHAPKIGATGLKNPGAKNWRNSLENGLITDMEKVSRISACFFLHFCGGSTLLRELGTFAGSTMHLQDLLREQAQLAAIVAQTLHTVAYLALLDIVVFRLKSPIQQRVTWDNFVWDNKDRLLFRHHLRIHCFT